MAEYLVGPREEVDPADPRRWEKLFAQCVALAGAGLCQFGNEGKHLYLNYIQALGKDNGFDVLGMKEVETNPSA